MEFWVGAGLACVGIAVGLGQWLIPPDVISLKIRAGLIVFAFSLALIGAGLIVYAVIPHNNADVAKSPAPSVRYPKDEGEAFKFTVRLVSISHRTKSLVTTFMVGFTRPDGDVVCPVNVTLLLDIINMQTVLSTIASYSVDVAPTSKGPWKRLMPIAIEGQKFFLSPEPFQPFDFTKALEITFNYADLADILKRRSLQPHETITGLALFERRDVTPDAIKFFKFHIADTAGVEANLVVPIPINSSSKVGEVNAQQQFSFTMLGFRDISKFNQKYCYSSYPD